MRIYHADQPVANHALQPGRRGWVTVPGHCAARIVLAPLAGPVEETTGPSASSRPQWTQVTHLEGSQCVMLNAQSSRTRHSPSPI